MADIKFSCPHCSQHITCDELWCGHEIQCPICQGALMVPAAAPAPAPAPTTRDSLLPKVPQSGASKLSLGAAASQHPGAGAQPPARSIPIRNLAPAKPRKKNIFLQIAKIGGTLIVVAGCLYGAYFAIQHYESKADSKAQSGGGSGEGQVAHIQALNAVLDATEPGGAGLGSLGQHHGTGPRDRSSAQRDIAVPSGDGGSMPGAGPDKQLPTIPPVWTDDVNAAKIPEGRANGSISGTNFVVETARLDVVGQAQALRLVQGQPTSPDREVAIYLHPKAGEKIGAQPFSLSVASDAKGVPTVIKRWKINPKYAPSSKTFYGGYVMKLELGQLTNGTIAGKLILCMPDPEKSVVGGSFLIAPNLFDMGTAATPTLVPMAAPANRYATPPTAGRSKVNDRYGIQ